MAALIESSNQLDSVVLVIEVSSRFDILAELRPDVDFFLTGKNFATSTCPVEVLFVRFGVSFLIRSFFKLGEPNKGAISSHESFKLFLLILGD